MSAIANEVISVSQIFSLIGSGKYLVILQNNTELRPTGGFIGSYATVKLSRGSIKSIEVESNIYRKDQQFIEDHKIPAPEPFQKIWPKSFIGLNSANWSADFSTSAELIEWIYNQQNQSGVDGVIAVNATVIPDLLVLTGPIYSTTLKKEIDSANFLSEIQKYIEKDYYLNFENQNTNEPKEILSELFELLYARLYKTNPIKLINLVEKKLNNHDLQFYIKDQEKQQLVLNNNWSMELLPWDGDYLYVNNANLGGGKGSLGVHQKLNYYFKDELNDQRNSLLQISRTNYGRSDFTVTDNLNYTRIYVPLGSQLNYIKLGDLDITNEVKIEPEITKTVFEFWFNTAIGDTQVATVSYLTPPLIESKLLVEHQPGSLPDQFSVANQTNQQNFELRNQEIIDILD